MKIQKSKGFTVAELLIVVAIIAVLVAVSIPIFTSQLEKARKAVCESNRASIQDVYIIDRMTDDRSTNGEILEKAKKAVLGDSTTGCTVNGSVYTYVYYTQTGAVTSASASDGVRIVVKCNIEGHGNTNLQNMQQSISDWIAGYTGTKFGNSVIDNYVATHGGTGQLLTNNDLSEMLGFGYEFKNPPANLYLKPFGATVYDSSGKAQLLDVQMVTSVPGSINSNDDMRVYAIIVEGQTYVMKNAEGKIVDSYRVGDNGPTFLDLTDYNSGNKSYSSIETFIDQITKNNRTYPFQQVN